MLSHIPRDVDPGVSIDCSMSKMLSRSSNSIVASMDGNGIIMYYI